MFVTHGVLSTTRCRQVTYFSVIVLAITLLFPPMWAGGVEVNGRISSTSFLYETYLPDQHQEWDLVNRLSINLRDLGTPDLSLHWSISHRGEIMEMGLDKSRPSTYHGFLRYRPGSNFALSVGRHWAYGGVAASRLDGVSLQLSRPALGRLVLYGGTRGFLAPDGDGLEGFSSDDFKESGIWGALYRSAPLPYHLSFTVSAARLFRGGQEEGRRLGFGARWQPVSTTTLRCEHRYDLVRETLYHLRLRLDHRFSAASGYLAWHRRQAFAPDNDQSYIVRYFRERTWFLDSFEQTSDELRAHVTLPLPRVETWKLRLDVIEIFPQDEDRGDGIALAVARENISFGYRLQRGFGGDTDGFFASLRHQLRSGIWAWVDLNQVSYKFGGIDNGDEYLRDDKTLATRLGCDLLLMDDLDLSVAIEYLNNPRAESEVRFLGRVGYRFHGGSQE